MTDNACVRTHDYDGLGSTRQLTDAAGSVAAAYDYDVFGTLKAKTGTADTPFRFTGEQVDDSTSLQYLRARYYDPGTGRFLSRDPFAGLVAVPQSLNRYAYVLNNPLYWVDPWGLCNVEGAAFGTPRPPGNYLVWGPVTPAGGCQNVHYAAPSSGIGIWGPVGRFAKAYWEHTPDYLVYQHVVAPAWEFATTRSPTCYVWAGGTAFFTGLAALSYSAGYVPVGQGFSEIAFTTATGAAIACSE
jgi:RHS repeat-associated protein